MDRPASAAPVLRAEGITKRLRDGDAEVTILSGISLAVAARERVALMGPSGSGKSTLLQILGALDAGYSGSVELFGTRLEGLSDAARAELRAKRLGFVFQAYNLLAHLTALENVLLPAVFASAAIDVERGRAVLTQVGLRDKAHRRPSQLSGGERQRVAIARAFYLRPGIVLCDEPTGNLDATTSREILALFSQLRDAGAALLIATHDEDIAKSADRVLAIRDGVLIQDPTKADPAESVK